MDIIVVDLEVNKEFIIKKINFEEDTVVIYNTEYGHCQQSISKIKFTNKHLDE